MRSLSMSSFDAAKFLCLFSLSCAIAAPAAAQCNTLSDCQLVWADEFDGDSLDLTKWEHMLGDGSQFGLPTKVCQAVGTLVHQCTPRGHFGFAAQRFRMDTLQRGIAAALLPWTDRVGETTYLADVEQLLDIRMHTFDSLVLARLL